MTVIFFSSRPGSRTDGLNGGNIGNRLVRVLLLPPTSPGAYFHYFGHVPYPNSKLMMRDARMLFGIAPAHAVYDDQ